MTTDLLKDFFGRELTEDEKSRLGELLESSPEAADRFASLAEEEYRSTGYPDPVTPVEAPSFWSERRWVWALGLVVVAFLGVAGWVLLSLAPTEDLATVRPATSTLLEASAELQTKAPGVPSVSKGRPQPRLKVTLPAAGRISIEILSSEGKTVRSLVSGAYPAGVHRFPWDEKDDHGRRVSPGEYRAVILRELERAEVKIRVGP